MTNRMFVMMIAAAGLFAGASVYAHCEIPCGIYGDHMRVDMLREHFKTVEKSMTQIKELESVDKPNANQLVRWVVNKDEHANKIQEIVYQYFMNQRVKPVGEDSKEYARYVKQVTLLHQMLVASMKCKQTTDASHVAALQTLLDAFEKAYFSEAEMKHNHASAAPEHKH